MKTIKEVSNISGLSIAALRYYDEIELLKPANYSESGYRLYDNNSIEKLQQILFFRELDIPLAEIKKIMENRTYNKEQVLLNQKALLERKRNRLNGIIELITDVVKGVNTMSFEAFNNNDISKIVEYFEQNVNKENLPKIMKFFKEHGVIVNNMEDIKKHLALSLKDDAINAQLKWYGSKDKVMDLYSEKKEVKSIPSKSEIDNIYKQFSEIKGLRNNEIETELVNKLEIIIKNTFHLDNARAMLLDLAEEYLDEKLIKPYDQIYGIGLSEYVAHTIRRYYGVN